MRIAAEGGSAPSAVPDAAARVLEFTQVARAGDLPLILNALSDAELTAGIARLGPRLPPPVIDYVITHGPQVARNTLAWQLRLPPRPPAVRLDFLHSPDAVREHAVQRDHDAVARSHDAARRRLLSRADPAIDRALFGRLEQGGIAWVRSAILRDRLGPDGEPILPPDLRTKLSAFLATAVLPLSPTHLADTDTGNPEFELLRVLAGARDLSLSLPASRVLGLPGPIPAEQPGWRDQVWVQRWDKAGAGSRSWRLDWDEVLALAADHESVAGDRGRFLGTVAGLDEAAAREDIPEDVRRRLLASYPQGAWHATAPDVTTLRRISAAVADLRHRWGDFRKTPEFVDASRQLIITGLALGTLTATEIIEYAVPARAVLDLAWRPADTIVPAARGRADLAEELRELLYKRIGDDVPLWNVLLVRSLVWPGTVAELVDTTAVHGPRPEIPDDEEIDEAVDDGVCAANVLLSFARPHVAAEVWSDGPGPLNPYELVLLEGRPLPPGLVSRALAIDAGHDARRLLAANPATPTAVLHRLLHHTADPLNTRLALLGDVADPAVRYAALEALEQSGTSWAQIMHVVKNIGEAGVYHLAAAAPNVERLHALLKKFGKHLGPDTSAILFGRLAEEAGPEPVWDVAVLAAGSLEKADPHVRSSMSSGEMRPLMIAAGLAARRHLPGVTVPDPARDPVPHPEDPASWPLETAVRQCLDNDPDRWRIMVRRLMEAGPLEYAQLVDLVQTVGDGDGAGEAAEGET